MLTKIWGQDELTVLVASGDEDVKVTVESDTEGLPNAVLNREATHDALIKAKAKAEDFIAAVEGDISATAPVHR